MLTAEEVKERCCSTIGSRRQGKFELKARRGATEKELKWATGTLTLQFKLAMQVPWYCGYTCVCGWAQCFKKQAGGLSSMLRLNLRGLSFL